MIAEVVEHIRRSYRGEPAWGIVLGSGLGGLADAIDARAEFPYEELPYFPTATAAGHAGRLVCGELHGVPVVAMKGRFHLYEGWSVAQATLPVRAMHRLGARRLLLSNAAGGLNPEYRVGDVMAIDDQIDLTFAGSAADACGGGRLARPAGPTPYCPLLIGTALAAARRAAFPLHRGVYVGMLGPTYETRAEYRMLRRIGGDAAGMSTVPEAIAASQHSPSGEREMRVVGFSIITNVCSPDALGATTHQDVQQAAGAAAEKLAALVRALLVSTE